MPVKYQKRRECPEPRDRVDGPGGRRIVVDRIRSQVYMEGPPDNWVLRCTPAYVIWRRPYKMNTSKCLLSTWRRWARRDANI